MDALQDSRNQTQFECPIFPIFSGRKKSGDIPLMLPAPTARRVPTETGFKLRVGSELTTIERLPVCNLGDHFWSEWGEHQSAPRCSGRAIVNAVLDVACAFQDVEDELHHLIAVLRA
jgi:hypothetical protein